MVYADRMTTVRGSVIRDVATEIAARNNPNLIKLSGGLPDESLFPMKDLQTAAEKIFNTPELYKESLQYGLTRGDTELVELLVARMNKLEGLNLIYDIEMKTKLMEYDYEVDAISGEVLGFDIAPLKK